MEITEVRIKLMHDPNERLLAFCSITFSSRFVIRDLKIIQGGKGPFVAMPSRKLTDRCPKCHSKNHLRAHFCNQCGLKLHPDRASKSGDGRAKLYADIAHPINPESREEIQEHVIVAYKQELIESQKADYVCRYDDFGEENYAHPLEDEDYSAESSGIYIQPKNNDSKISETVRKSQSGATFRFDKAHSHNEVTSEADEISRQKSSTTDEDHGTQSADA